MEEYTLVASSNSGRYSLQDTDGWIRSDVTSSTSMEIKAGNQWIAGSVEYGYDLYSNVGIKQLGQQPPEPRLLEGYYFVPRGGGVIGLCAGMVVRIQS